MRFAPSGPTFLCIFRQDYIQRQIKMLVEVLARIAGMRAGYKLDEAEQEAAAAWGELFGFPPGLVDRVDAQTLRSLLGPERLATARDLLLAEAETFDARGDDERARQRRALAEKLS